MLSKGGSVSDVSQVMRLDQLDERQREAVDSTAATLCIVAGPGSGKTRVLTHRIARRVEDGTADPRRILALTFTRRAANELRNRLHRVGVRDVGAVGTFHAIALAQVRRHRIDAGKRPPTVLGNRRQVLVELLGERPQIQIGLAATEIDWACAQALTSDEYRHGPGRSRVGDGAAKAIAALHDSYREYKRRRGVLDFDDLLLECARLLRTDPAFRDAQQWLFRHLFVDEFQDVNRAQFELLSAWLGDRDDLCVVGDPDQAIYGWNGADAGYLTAFSAEFPGAEVLHLRANHRSTEPIVRASEAVLGLEPSPPGREGGSRPTITEYADGREEAIGIARRLRHSRQPGESWSRHAVLARTNAQLTVLSEALAQLRVPYRIRGRGGILRLPEVAQVVDQLVDAGPGLAATAEDLMAELDAGPAARMAELAAQFAREDHAAHGDGFRSWLRTVSPGDLEGSRDAVDLVTFHAAKGLEWPSVIIAGVEDGFVPIRSGDPEERRLLYVAVSRAENELHLTWARERSVAGQLVERDPSPWLGLIEAATEEPPPPPPERVTGLLREARSAVEPEMPPEESACLARLNQWRTRTARARRIEAGALLPDSAMRRIAEAQPTDLETLVEATHLRPERLHRISDEILTVVAGP